MPSDLDSPTQWPRPQLTCPSCSGQDRCGASFPDVQSLCALITSPTREDGPQNKSCAADRLPSVVSVAWPQTASKFKLALPFNWVVKCCFPPTLATSLASGYSLAAGQASRHIGTNSIISDILRQGRARPFPFGKSGSAGVWLHFHEGRIPSPPTSDLNYLAEFSAAKMCPFTRYVFMDSGSSLYLGLC